MKFNPDNLYVVKPMILIQTSEHTKLNIPMGLLKQLGISDYEPETVTRLVFLALRSDITFALDKGDKYTSIFTGEEFLKYSNPHEEDYVAYAENTLRLSEVLFEEKSKKCAFNIKDALDSGIYASIISSYDKVAEDILSREFDEEELKEVLKGVKKNSKDKLVYIENSVSGENKKTKVYEKTFRR